VVGVFVFVWRGWVRGSVVVTGVIFFFGEGRVAWWQAI